MAVRHTSLALHPLYALQTIPLQSTTCSHSHTTTPRMSTPVSWRVRVLHLLLPSLTAVNRRRLDKGRDRLSLRDGTRV